MSPQHLAFVESNTTGTGRLAIERLAATGARVTFFSRQPAKYPFLTALGDRVQVVEVETNELEVVGAAVAEVHAARPIDALLSFSTFYVPTVALLADRFGFPYLRAQAAMACHDKYRCRQLLRAAGLRVPDFWKVTTGEEAEAAARAVSFPCVVKPLAESSSTGVRVVESAEELIAHYRLLAARRINERGQPLSGEALVEGFLSGPEYSVETVTLPEGRTEVIGIAAKYLGAPPFCVEMGHDVPAALDPADADAMVAAVRQGLDAVGYDFGPAHTELRVTADGPVIVEINPRLGGGMIPELIRLARGIDMLQVVLDMALGKTPQLGPVQEGVAGIRFLTSERDGVLQAIAGLEEAEDLATIREVRVARQPGAPVRRPQSSLDRLGYVIASGDERARVESDLHAALSRIRITVS